MNNRCICWFFTHIFTGDFLVFKGLIARRVYKSFGVKGLKDPKIYTFLALLRTLKPSTTRCAMQCDMFPLVMLLVF
jgi:hypothetical protein